MQSYCKGRAQSVEVRGAAGNVVRGAAANNHGVRIRVLYEQPKGYGGALCGAFVILDAGDNKHTHDLLPLLGRETDAAEVLRMNRRDSPSCLSIANANILVPEERPPEGAAAIKEPHRDEADRPPPQPARPPRKSAPPGPGEASRGIPGSLLQPDTHAQGPEGTVCTPTSEIR